MRTGITLGSISHGIPGTASQERGHRRYHRSTVVVAAWVSVLVQHKVLLMPVKPVIRLIAEGPMDGDTSPIYILEIEASPIMLT